MEPLPIPNITKRILSISTIFILISTFVVIFIGYSLGNINQEIKRTNAFLAGAQDIQPNFEKSLQLYTESTQKIIDYLISLRPDSEEDYLKFIFDIEETSEKLGLDLNLESTQDIKLIDSKTLQYNLNFFGTNSDLITFLQALEKLPYFIRVNEIDFKNPQLLTDEDINGNVNLKISLYIK